MAFDQTIIANSTAAINIHLRVIAVTVKGAAVVNRQESGHENWSAELEILDSAVATGGIGLIEEQVDTLEGM